MFIYPYYGSCVCACIPTLPQISSKLVVVSVTAIFLWEMLLNIIFSDLILDTHYITYKFEAYTSSEDKS